MEIDEKQRSILKRAIDFYPAMEGGNFKECVLLCMVAEHSDKSSVQIMKEWADLLEILCYARKKASLFRRARSFISSSIKAFS